MGIAYNPRVVTDGLVLALDAGNNKSHSTNRFISYGTGLTTQAVNFSIQGTTGFNRVAAGTIIGGYEVKATDVVYSYALGSNGCHYHGNTAPIPAGVYATFSFDYLVTGATNYPSADYLANFENYGGGALSGSIATANNTQNVWQRRTFTSGPTGSAGTQAMFLYPGGCGGRLADSGTIYFRNPKVEWTNVDTGDGNFSSMSNVTTWYDMSGNGNNGTLTNTPYYFISSNGTNGYMSFDGTDDKVIIPYNSNLNPSNVTISVWFKRNSSVNYSHFAGLPASNTSWNPPYISYGIEFIGTTDQPALVLGFSDNTFSYTTASASASTAVGLWVNVVGTYDKSFSKIYVNGQLITSNVETKTLFSTSANFVLGTETQDTSGYPLNGNIAQVQIYNRALTAAEISQNFNATRARFGI